MVKKTILISFNIIFILTCLFSNNNFEITISSSKECVNENEPFLINLSVSTNGFVVKDIKKSDEIITLFQQGISTMSTYINGKASVSYTITYYCKIPAAGEYEIGPFLITANNEELESEIVKIKVNKQSNDNHDNNTNQKIFYETQKNNSVKNLYFLKTNANKKEIYVNEPVEIGVIFLTRINPDYFYNQNYKELIFPKTSWHEEIKINKSPDYKIINGKKYLQFEMERNKVYLTKPGKFLIEPAEFSFLGLQSPDPFAHRESINIKTDPIEITVNDFPENPPKSFNGAVGKFNLDVSLSSTNVNINEPITMKIILTGDGNFLNINEIGYDISKSIETFKSQPGISSQNNKTKTKTWEILLVPSRHGNFKVSIDDFSYFDVSQKKYITIPGKQFKLNVRNAKNSIENTEDNNDEKDILVKNNNTDLMQNKIRFIRLNPGRKRNDKNYNYWFYFIIILYISVTIFLILFIIIKYLLFNNYYKLELIKEKNAFKVFSNNINKIKNKIINKNETNVIDSISNAMENYFIKKYRIDAVEFTNSHIKKNLCKHVSEIKTKNLCDIISRIDMIRFGGFDVTQDELLELIDEIKKFIENIEKNKMN